VLEALGPLSNQFLSWRSSCVCVPFSQARLRKGQSPTDSWLVRVSQYCRPKGPSISGIFRAPTHELVFDIIPGMWVYYSSLKFHYFIYVLYIECTSFVMMVRGLETCLCPHWEVHMQQLPVQRQLCILTVRSCWRQRETWGHKHVMKDPPSPPSTKCTPSHTCPVGKRALPTSPSCYVFPNHKVGEGRGGVFSSLFPYITAPGWGWKMGELHVILSLAARL
jgi:hypothetical protein